MDKTPPKRLSSIAVIGIAFFALLFFWSTLMVVTFRIPHTGVTAAVHADDPRACCWEVLQVEPRSSAVRAGLRRGDIVVYSKPIASTCTQWFFKCRPFRLFSGKPVPRFQLAHPLTLAVTRGSHHFFATLDPSEGSLPYPVADLLALLIRLVVYTGFVVLGTWLVLLRPGLMSWAFFATCLSLAAPTGLAALTFVEVLQHGAPLDTFWNISMAFQLALIALPIFLLRFPDDSSPGWRRPMLVFALWTLPWAFPLAFVFDAYDYLASLKIPILLLSFGILVAMYVLARGADRKRLQWAIVGIIAAILAALLISGTGYIPAAGQGARSMGMSILDEYSFSRYAILDVATILYAMMLICLVYAIVKHRVIDVRFIASRSIVIGIMFMLFAALFGGLDWLFTVYASQSKWQIAIGMAAAFIFGGAIHSWRKYVADFVDGVFFREHHVGVTELRELRLMLERDPSRLNVQDMVTKDAAICLHLASAALFAPTSDGGFIRQRAIGWDSGTAWHLLPGDPIIEAATAPRAKHFSINDAMCVGLAVPTGLAQPAVAVLVTLHRRIVALALYGAHTNGAAIDPDEIGLLVDLCRAAAASFDRRETVGVTALEF